MRDCGHQQSSGCPRALRSVGQWQRDVTNVLKPQGLTECRPPPPSLWRLAPTKLCVGSECLACKRKGLQRAGAALWQATHRPSQGVLHARRGQAVPRACRPPRPLTVLKKSRSSGKASTSAPRDRRNAATCQCLPRHARCRGVEPDCGAGRNSGAGAPGVGACARGRRGARMMSAVQHAPRLHVRRFCVPCHVGRAAGWLVCAGGRYGGGHICLHS